MPVAARPPAVRPRLKVVTAELSLADGERVEGSEQVRVVVPHHPSNQARGVLALLAEPVRDDTESLEAARLTLDTIEGHYYVSRATNPATRLIEGIEAAHSRLRRTMPGYCRRPEGGVGVSCVAILDGMAYVAETPPAAVAVLHQERIEPIGSHAAFRAPDWASAANLEVYNAVGTPRPPSIDVSQQTVSAGDTVALFSPRLARLLPLEGVRRALAFQQAHVGVERLQDLAGHYRARSGSALVIEIGGELVEVEESTAQDGGLPRFTIWHAEARATPGGTLSVAPPPNDATTPPRTTVRAPRAAGLPGGWKSQARDGLRALALLVDSWVWMPQWMRPVRALPDMPPPQPGPPVVPAGAPRPVRRLARRSPGVGWLAQARGWLDRPLRLRDRRRRPVHAAVYVALGLLVAAGGGSGLAWQWHLKAEQARFDGLLAQAAQVEQQALATPDRAAARPLFTRAIDLGQQALATRIDNDRASAFIAKTNGELEKAGAVVHVRLRSILNLGSDGSDRGPISLVPVGRNLYVLDGGAQQVVSVGLEGGEPQVLLRKGERVGPKLVGTLKQLVVAAQKLAVLDDAGVVWAYDLHQQRWAPLPIRNDEPLRTALAFDFYSTNMYALQPSGAVTKWGATERGFDAPPAFYIKSDPAAGANPVVAFSVDGSLLLMRRDGSVTRYLAGDRQEFSWQGLDRPLASPTAIWSSPNSDSIFVADAGNRRVVEFDHDGRFQRQLVPPAGDSSFDALRQVALEDTGRLYVASGSKVYSFVVPQAAG